MNFIRSIKVNLLSSAILCVILGIVLVAYPDTIEGEYKEL